MRRFTTAFVFTALVLIPFIASAGETNHCLDPVTTYTNGMPLASSTSLRSHNVYYKCDPDHLGCCNGKYNWPCLNSLLHPNSCCTGHPLAASELWGDDVEISAIEAVEVVRFQQLGALPFPQIAGPTQPASPASPSLINRLGL